MQTWLFKSATQMAKAIRRRDVSAVELVRRHLDRIEATHSTLNAVVTRSAERALMDAADTDKRVARNQATGVLAGVPITIKDSFDTAGIVTTYGMAERATTVPEKDATVVARLREAGAIILGKTNTSELTVIDAAGTRNRIFGQTNNPHDIAYSPSGSSGGSAVAVAAGCSALDIGSDTGGSIRDPAHVCGVVGMKPSAGLVPRTGHCVSFGMGELDALTQIGPMARSVDDIATILSVISGRDGSDPDVIVDNWKGAGEITSSELNIAFYTENGLYPSSPETIAAIETAADAVRDAGAQVVEICPDTLSKASALFERMIGSDSGMWKQRLARYAVSNGNCGQSQPIFQTGPDWPMLQADISEFRANLTTFFGTFDAIMGPVAPEPARRHTDTERAYSFWNELSAYNISGYPAISVPVGRTRAGLPVGVQIASGSLRDNVVLAVAREVESRVAWHFLN